MTMTPAEINVKTLLAMRQRAEAAEQKITEQNRKLAAADRLARKFKAERDMLGKHLLYEYRQRHPASVAQSMLESLYHSPGGTSQTEVEEGDAVK